jgi:hypothetical protein
LTPEEEASVIQYVRDSQKSGFCYKVSEIVFWINNELLKGDRTVSDRFLLENSTIMAQLKTKCPKKVDQDRTNASFYGNFTEFFEKLTILVESGVFDTDLIFNVDETKASANEPKGAAQVVYDPDISIPTTAFDCMDEHITLTCGISASGKRLMPVFIIKNKSITTERILRGPHFEYGDFGIQHSKDGWQNAVSTTT